MSGIRQSKLPVKLNEAEIEEFGKCFGTPHFTEGTSAFLDKRKPSFN